MRRYINIDARPAMLPCSESNATFGYLDNALNALDCWGDCSNPPPETTGAGIVEMSNFPPFARNNGADADSCTLSALKMADGLLVEMSRAIYDYRVPLLSNSMQPHFPMIDPPVFASHPVYSQAGRAMRSFLTQTALVIEQGDAQGAKPIETLYVQWVFFELCAAFRVTGLSCVSHRSVFDPISRNRFTVDLDRNSAIMFEMANGPRVSIRCEATILPRRAAQGVDTLY